MLQTSFGFSFLSASIITALIYFITREKHKTEQEQKEKIQHMIMIYVISFVVILFGKLCLSDKQVVMTQAALSKVPDMKGGQCPF